MQVQNITQHSSATTRYRQSVSARWLYIAYSRRKYMAHTAAAAVVSSSNSLYETCPNCAAIVNMQAVTRLLSGVAYLAVTVWLASACKLWSGRKHPEHQHHTEAHCSTAYSRQHWGKRYKTTDCMLIADNTARHCMAAQPSTTLPQRTDWRIRICYFMGFNQDKVCFPLPLSLLSIFSKTVKTIGNMWYDLWFGTLTV